MKRREFIRRGLQWGSLAAMPALFSDRVVAAPANSLKALGAPCGMKVGVQSIKAQLQNPVFARTVIANFEMLTPGNELKWARLRPGPDSYNFNDADWMVDFAQQNGMLVHGHNLCWNAEGNEPALACRYAYKGKCPAVLNATHHHGHGTIPRADRFVGCCE